MPPSRQQRIRAYAAALSELASGIASSGDLRLLQRVVPERLSVANCDAAFGTDEQAAVQAALRVLSVLADERHDRSVGWLQLLDAAVVAYTRLMGARPGHEGGRNAWLEQQLTGGWGVVWCGAPSSTPGGAGRE
jgi:hypothetical protein